MGDEILKGISKILSANSPNKRRMADLVNENSIKSQKEADFGEINETNRHVLFNNEFMQDFYFMKKKEEILNYVHSQGYTTNLD